jgi:hypothetical protein
MQHAPALEHITRPPMRVKQGDKIQFVLELASLGGYPIADGCPHTLSIVDIVDDILGFPS